MNSLITKAYNNYVKHYFECITTHTTVKCKLSKQFHFSIPQIHPILIDYNRWLLFFSFVSRFG